MNCHPLTYDGPGLSPLSRQISSTPSNTSQLSPRRLDFVSSFYGSVPSMPRRKKTSNMLNSMAGVSEEERPHPLRRSTRVVSRMKSLGSMGSLRRMGSFMRRHGDQGGDSKAESNIEAMTQPAEDMLPGGVDDLPEEGTIAGSKYDSVGNQFGNEEGHGRQPRRPFRHSSAPIQHGRKASYEMKPSGTLRRWKSRLFSIPDKLESPIKNLSFQTRRPTQESGESFKEHAVMVRFPPLGPTTSFSPILTSSPNGRAPQQSQARAALILLNQHTSFSDLMSKIHEVPTQELFGVSALPSEYSTCSVCACFHEEVHVWKRRLCVEGDLELSRVLRYMEMGRWKRIDWLEVEWGVRGQVEPRERSMTGETARRGSSVYSRTTGGGAISREEMMTGGGGMREVLAPEGIGANIVQKYRGCLPHDDRWGKDGLEGDE